MFNFSNVCICVYKKDVDKFADNEFHNFYDEILETRQKWKVKSC